MRALDKGEARRVNYKASQYYIIQDTIYRKWFTLPYLKCLKNDQSEYVLKEIHKGIFSNYYRA